MDMQKTFDRFASDLQKILGGNLYDIIIHGSYALNDFHPGKGDLDYVVLTNADLDQSVNSMLFGLHDEYRSKRELCLYQLEGTYYPKHVLQNPGSEFIGCYIGTGRKGWRTINSFQNSFTDLKIINDHGISLLNKNIFVYKPSDEEIKADCIKDLENITERAKDNNAGNDFWLSLIYWCARTIYYIKSREIASKNDACRFCMDRINLSQYIAAFTAAETARHLHEDIILNKNMKNKCKMLLKYVESILR